MECSSSTWYSYHSKYSADIFQPHISVAAAHQFIAPFVPHVQIKSKELESDNLVTWAEDVATA